MTKLLYLRSWPLALFVMTMLTASPAYAQHQADSVSASSETISAPDTSIAVHRAGFFPRLGDTLLAGVTSRPESKPLSWKSISIPAGLITLGTLSFTSEWVGDFNAFGRRFTNNDQDPNERTNVDDHTLYIPAVTVGALHLAGVRGKNNIVDAGLMVAISQTLAYAGIVAPIKKLTATERPDASNNLSFPSGHTAAAFVSAEFLRQEYKDISPWIGAGGYACAILTGYLRMYNNKHWFSDVVAGAGVGIISTRVTYWLYPKLKNAILRKVDPKGNAMIFPHYQQGGLGVTAIARF